MTDNQENDMSNESEVTVVDDAAVVETEAIVTQGARLVLKRAGAETDITFPVNPPTFIGRFDPSVGPIDVDLGTLTPEGGYVSRKHAKITVEDGVYTLHDLGSSNGTFVLRDDFERVDQVELTDGQEIAFGNARFVFRIA